jgi:hypothetical protein
MILPNSNTEIFAKGLWRGASAGSGGSRGKARPTFSPRVKEKDLRVNAQVLNS